MEIGSRKEDREFFRCIFPWKRALLLDPKEERMRTMIRIKIPVESGNKAFADGSLAKTITEALERLKPEAAYFFPDHGLRSALMVVDLQDSSQIPSAVEHFFSKLNAAVELTPVMNAEDLRKGLERAR
jgi:hypothetical protein